jgi:hypothetical protein
MSVQDVQRFQSVVLRLHQDRQRCKRWLDLRQFLRTLLYVIDPARRVLLEQAAQVPESICKRPKWYGHSQRFRFAPQHLSRSIF